MRVSGREKKYPLFPSWPANRVWGKRGEGMMEGMMEGRMEVGSLNLPLQALWYHGGRRAIALFLFSALF